MFGSVLSTRFDDDDNDDDDVDVWFATEWYSSDEMSIRINIYVSCHFSAIIGKKHDFDETVTKFHVKNYQWDFPGFHHPRGYYTHGMTPLVPIGYVWDTTGYNHFMGWWKPTEIPGFPMISHWGLCDPNGTLLQGFQKRSPALLVGFEFSETGAHSCKMHLKFRSLSGFMMHNTTPIFPEIFPGRFASLQKLSLRFCFPSNGWISHAVPVGIR